ncbi:MAG: molybdopterin-dependent oxidoreductase, partial [Gammaproteobacteria bacterium]
KQVDWETALNLVATKLRAQAFSLGVLASASSTTEELYLLGRIARGLGTSNIDHRLRQRDFRDQAADPAYPTLGLAIADIEKLDSLLLIGANIRKEAPVLAHRVRKAARRGAKVSFVNPARFDYLFPVAAYLESSAATQVAELAAILSAASEGGAAQVPAHLSASVRDAKVSDEHRAIATNLRSGEKRAVILGALALRNSAYADLRALASAIAQATGASFGVLAEGGNAAGAFIAGAVPHREAGGRAAANPGLSSAEMLSKALGAYVLFGGVEPWIDALDSEVARTLASSGFVVAITPFESAQLRDVAHVMLPIGTYVETSGTYVNLEGKWQSYAGAVAPLGEARPGWKVLRVLGNLLNLTGFEYQTSEDVREELRSAAGEPATNSYAGTHTVNGAPVSVPVVDLNMYQSDALVRRAPSLQKTREGRTPPAHY